MMRNNIVIAGLAVVLAGGVGNAAQFELPRLSPKTAAVAGVERTTVDLGGEWRFNPSPTNEWQSPGIQQGEGWLPINVPGEWAMQGFVVTSGTAVGYLRSFSLPTDWGGKRIILRCDAVYSDAIVWINGKEAGRHSGGFTPFELDITDLVNRKGPNTLAISALNESVADTLASGTKYACHQLGGIPRGIRLVVLPETSLSSLQVTTTFDAGFSNAVLGVELGVVCAGSVTSGKVEALLALMAPDGQSVSLSPNRIPIAARAGAVAIPVTAPAKWDPEHPRLYTLTVKLEVDGRDVETVVQKVGFRQVEVRGNELFVNGMPVKLRGCNRHEVYPVTGRSLPAGTHRRDVELFREGNVNLLRTCHYPPDEALMDAADELGMFIECEAPFCWANGGGHTELICRQTAEMVLTFRNHPSVLFWSLANESKWGAWFAASSDLVRRLDPTRPQVFNDAGGSPSDPKYTQIISSHYPGHAGPASARKGMAQPYYQGEECHLNAYNRLELATDPALRDIWGRYLREMWDDLYNTTGSLGQSIWSGVDDTFYLKDDQTVGYGTWGPIDGWRRPKPEYWNMKKAYSPVRVLNGDALASTGKVIRIDIENRQVFSNLREMTIAWVLGGQSGKTTADLAPGAKGSVPVKLRHDPKPGEKLELTFTDPRGFVADQFDVTLLHGEEKPVKPHGQACKVAQSADDITVSSGEVRWILNQKTGLMEGLNEMKLNGPALMLLPLSHVGGAQMTGKTKVWTPFTEPCAGWACAKVAVEERDGSVRVKVDGKVEKADGSFTYDFLPGGVVQVGYAFTVTKAVNPRQVGLVFTLPRECEVFSWKREGYWNVYPKDHIARLEGTVRASEGFAATSVGPREKPAHPWRLDKLPYGNNDFCSTKHNVLTARLVDAAGNGLVIDGGGKQHVRCWRTDVASNCLVADYSNGGAEQFLRVLTKFDDRPLKLGDKVSGVVTLSPAAAP